MVQDSGDTDFDEYFEDVVGVSRNPEGRVETVRARVKKPDAWYVDTKPIHSSQKKEEETERDMTFEWRVIVNEEFVQSLFSYANRTE